MSPIEGFLQSNYQRLAPEWLRQLVWARKDFGNYITFRRLGSFIRSGQERMILAIACFANINRPFRGYYMEFGCYSAWTMRKAWQYTRHQDWTYIGFDSFEGLPAITDIDKQEIWEPGKLAITEQEYIRRVTSAGMPRDRLMTVKGFYQDSLTSELAAKLPQKAVAIYIDCDLYASTVDVLKFIPGFLQPGTIIVFDDWDCHLSNPDRGERRAWREFREAHPKLRFEQFARYPLINSFVYVGQQTTADGE